MKKVLVDVDEALWGRMKARAAEREELIATTVARAFREHLAWQKDWAEKLSREVAPRPSNGPSNDPSNEPEGLAPVSAVERLRELAHIPEPRRGVKVLTEIQSPTETGDVHLYDTSIKRVMELVNGVHPGGVQTAREVARAREARRGGEGESQVPPDEEFGF